MTVLSGRRAALRRVVARLESASSSAWRGGKCNGSKNASGKTLSRPGGTFVCGGAHMYICMYVCTSVRLRGCVDDCVCECVCVRACVCVLNDIREEEKERAQFLFLLAEAVGPNGEPRA